MSQSQLILSRLLNELGEARNDSHNAYERYKELKGIEDQVRYELEAALHGIGLRSAKGENFTASIVEKPTIVVKSEVTVIEWLKESPEIESDRYIGIKAAEFKSLAESLLKGTGEVVPGCEVEVRESLAIRANKKPAQKVQG